ncbi:histidine kinase N-terminal 7TM domain-containing protein [Pedobacter sp. SYSU D00535]|uniref:histidine kinase N-terminal 7TM domain-containing protein n=1 Tax=Pedobacter sp. SYSU D00535 TaxID=2810308 RepID=UPI001A96E0A3|nr:histidine kinase N-terminal 7TM domain-containing protein [Pedobacter sp. SYSU D00535]
MNLDLNVFSSILLFSGSFNLFVALLLFQRLEKRLKPFSYIMIAISIWALGYGVQLSSHTYNQILFSTYLEYVGIASTPALWQIAIIRFIGKEKWLAGNRLALIFLIPVTTMVLLLTNEHHYLYYSTLELVQYRGMAFLEITKGPWYMVNTAYFYTMLLWGLYLLVAQFKIDDKIYKKQRNVIVLGALGPWLFNVTYQVGYKPFLYLDLTPYAFILTSIIVSLGFFRYKLFEFAPIAKEKVFDVIQEGVLVLDRLDRVASMNPEMRHILKHVSMDIIGQDAKAVFPGNQEFQGLVSSQKNRGLELELWDEEKLRTFSVSSTSMFEDQLYTGKIIIFRDVTEFYAREKMRLLMQKKDDFLSIASHELKTPLTTMKGYLKIAEGIADKLEDPSCRDFIRKAGKQTDKLAGLINDLLDVSKIESGKMQYHLEDFPISEVIEDCIDFANNTSSNHIVVLEGNSDLQVRADRNRLEQVICNLLSNAIKYSPESPVVSINVSQHGSFCHVSVKDLGIGIPRQKHEQLFQKFYRAENVEQRFAGLGIGLFIANEIVLRHGGKMTIDSEEGKGATFSFLVPLATEAH